MSAKLTAQTAITAPASSDIVYVVHDPSGTPASRKCTLANLALNLPAIVCTDATTPSIETASGSTNTGFLGVKGKTSGELKITVADALAQTLIVSALAQTSGGATISIPNFAGVNDTFAFTTLAQTLSNKTLAAAVLTGKLTRGIVATPVAAAGAGGGVAGAAQLGSAAILYVSSDGATKGVKLVAGVAGDVVDVINTSATACNLFAASGGTINGGSTDAGCAIAASKGVRCFCSAANTWTVFDMPAHAGAAA